MTKPRELLVLASGLGLAILGLSGALFSARPDEGPKLEPGQKTTISLACHTAQSALAFGVSLDLHPQEAAETLRAAIVGSACFELPPTLQHPADGTLVRFVVHKEKTDVWEVDMEGVSVFIPVDATGKAL